MYKCDKCGGDKIINPNHKESIPIKMSDAGCSAITLEYKLTTLRCLDCGYEVTY